MSGSAAGSLALAPAGEPAPDARGHLLEIGRSALVALLDLVPRALWRGFKGSFGGFFLMGFLGLAVAGAAAGANAWGILDQPRWLVLVNLAWVPLVFAVAGAYSGAINGFLSAVSDEVERRGLAARVFAVVKPVCLAAVARARGAPGSDLTADLRASLERRLDEDRPGRAASLGERAEQFLAARSRRLLCFSILRTVVTARDRETALRELETFGVQRLTMILTDTIEDLFSAQVYLAAALALVAAAAPAIVFALSR